MCSPSETRGPSSLAHSLPRSVTFRASLTKTELAMSRECVCQHSSPPTKSTNTNLLYLLLSFLPSTLTVFTFRSTPLSANPVFTNTGLHGLCINLCFVCPRSLSAACVSLSLIPSMLLFFLHWHTSAPDNTSSNHSPRFALMRCCAISQTLTILRTHSHNQAGWPMQPKQYNIVRCV